MGKTPAQKKRNQYLAAVRARGASGYNLWFVRPPQDGQALPLTLASDIELEAFFYLEGSPELVSVDYSPLRHGLAPAQERRRHFATVSTLEGAEFDVDLDPEADKASVAGRRLINLATLNRAKVRIQSWRAIVPTLNRCRSHSLAPVIIRCRQLLEERGQLEVRDLCQQLATEPTALVTGAVATLLRAREIQSDVDIHLWGPNTVLRAQHDG
ncbi:MAG: hypothetical protein DI562_03470 [Stenotrophomonas acidaminiphila]|uniref:hypothetical protein n=1 Tax=Pseudoxanthomonas TaxID=83618 RepID=UPI000DB4CACF|nr:hypothetical protein [Pseudoxanthomonas mexicana]PZQ32477.1 MAG: hypothetical protein DI562_03470 [Stenotrophomonas acidaminiphila]